MASPSRTAYYLVFAALIALLLVTVGAAYLHLGMWAAPVAMAIATAKAFLIVMTFMHVRYESGIVRLFAASGFLWLGILFSFLLADYWSRRSESSIGARPHPELIQREF
jgi:cytochrome c oxidase subunit 4